MPTPDMSKVIDGYGVAKIRDWVKQYFLAKADAEEMMASKIKITFGADFEGETYTITGGANETYTGTVPASLIITQTIKALNTTYTVSCDNDQGVTYSKVVTIGSYYGIYQDELMSFRAYMACTADAGATVVAVSGSKTYSGVADNTGHVTLTIGAAGTYSVTATLNGETTTPVSAVISTDGETVNVKLPSLILEIVSWADGTDEQIAAMVEAMDAGTLSIEDSGWQIGDERTVSLAAMAATGVGESHAAQSVTLVLMDSQHYDLVDGGKDHFVVGLKHSLNEAGYMNSSNTNTGSWDGSARRTWCNNVFKAAIPETLRACFKQFKTITAETYNGSTTKISNDYFALFAEQEIFGARTYSNTTEAAALTQIEWYKTAANRIKQRSGSADLWWERSPFSNSSNYFCSVNSNGSAHYYSASSACGLAPFGCI